MAQANTPAYRRVSRVTRSTMKLEPEKQFYLKIASRINESANAGKKNADGSERKRANVMLATNMVTGEEVQIVVPTVLHSNLLTLYPDHSYVGRAFEITRHAPGNGKDYSTFDVWEVDPSPNESKK